MELLILAGLALAAALVVRRKEAFSVTWRPDRHTWVAVAAGLAAFGLSVLLLLLEGGAWPGKVVLFGLIWAGCGFALPWGYVLLVEKSGPAGLALTRQRLGLSLILNLALGGMLFGQMAVQADLSLIEPGVFARGALVLLTGNVFELFLYFGFIHPRLERAFGVIPAVLGTASIYLLWHLGTQIPLEADPWAAAWKLWLVGVYYQSVFSIARNLLAVWPFFLGAGVLIDFVVNFQGLEPVSRSASWAGLTWGLMVLSALVLAGLVRRRRRAEP